MKKLILVPSSLVLLFLLVLPFTLMAYASITVKDHGVLPLEPGDVAMIFYATVSNKNSVSQRVRLNMSQCCLILPDSSQDCKSMKLLQGIEGNLKPRASFNLTMYYIAENLYNRRGTCILKILSWASDRRTSRQLTKRELSPEITFSFNTSLPKATLIDQLQFQLGGSKDGYTLCSTPHLDPERNCQEDNCLIRFSGHRSFFHEESQLCQSTSKCTSNDNEVLSPITGKCKEIPSANQISSFPEIRKEALEINLLEGLSNSEYIEKPISNLSSISEHVISLTSTMPSMKCVNGNKTHFGCICDEGWTSVDLNSSTSSNLSDTEEFSLCNILTSEGKLLERARLHRDNVIVLSIMLGTLCVVGVMGVLWLLYNRIGPKGYNILKESKDNEDGVSEDVISEIAGRRESTLGKKFSPSSSNPQLPQISSSQSNTASSKMNQMDFSGGSEHGNSSATNQQREGALASSFPNPGHVSHYTDSTKSFITSTRATTDMSDMESASAFQSSESFPDYEGLILTPSSGVNSSATDIDTLISLSHNEKLRTKSEPVLFPSKTKDIDLRKAQSTYKYPQSLLQITTEDLANNNTFVTVSPQNSSTSGADSSFRETDFLSSSGQLSRVESSKVFELNTAQKQEEWDKFLKFFTTCKLSRRRSLCSTPEEQVQEALRYIRDGITAHKTYSMPALRSTNPFVNYTTDDEASYAKSFNSSTGRSSNESSGRIGGSSGTSVWSSLSSSSDLMSSCTSHESSSDDFMAISINPKLLLSKDCNSNNVPGKIAANFNFSLTQQPNQSTSHTNVQTGGNLGSLRYGTSDTDPYVITAKLKEVLKASKSRSVDSLIKNTLEQRR